MEIVQKLHSLDSIQAMTEWLFPQNQNFVRKYLLREFDKVCHYKTAKEWNDAVRICEALAIIGWGDRGRVDATSSHNSNWWYTEFTSVFNDECFKYGRWLKRKAGFYITNYDKYREPNHVDRSSVEYVQTYEEGIVCTPVESLLSQRNYLVKMQFTFRNAGAHTYEGDLINLYTEELRQILKQVFDPMPYATVLEEFCIVVRTGWVKNGLWKLRIGSYHSKRKSFVAYLNIERDLAELSEIEQRSVLIEAVKACIQAFVQKLEKRKIDFPSNQFITDVNVALMSFAKPNGMIERAKERANEPNPMMDMLNAFAAGVKQHQKENKHDSSD